ncbi:hypothetical protein PDK35_02545 [Bacillus cereus group sp. TH153LC]|uniref:hypothetical protein n=1 Tax=Bacillus cereus group sp. TH153LC TaxID=3018059 RepID=UPI0022E40E9F|nr:hypothetical protein [Bacillus cereus group sp. TH153LC]MDA1658855.1 hypothetical protein [Bacillus cereus group sp. TH153LC]
MKDNNLKAWVTYKDSTVKHFGVDDSLDSVETWEQYSEVTVLSVYPPSFIARGEMWGRGLFVVMNSEGDVCGFDGHFISFINPNTKELN